ncbi:MAG: DUF3108 domain-containing protein [Opitutales bacterium]|nr:DUF3108 domain-containing protein [Opitutales bacterium]
MIRYLWFISALIFGAGGVLLGGELKQTVSLPFKVGERLEYDLKWGFFPVGSAVMEVLLKDSQDRDGPKIIRFSVRTNSFADTFYKVRTQISSTIDSLFTRALRYEKSQHEGNTRREIVVDFDYDRGEARYLQNDSSPVITSIPGPVFDPLSIAYFFRLHPLQPGGETHLPTCDGKRFRKVIVRAGEREKINLPMGKVVAIGTTPAMENLGGVFNKSPKGMLQVWYSDDERRVPVRVSSKVIVGSFTATLTSANPPLVLK